MQTILIIIGLLAIAAGVGYVLIKKGKIKESDGDFIPDVVEDKVDEVKGKVQKKVKAVKTRVKNVKDCSDRSRCDGNSFCFSLFG